MAWSISAGSWCLISLTWGSLTSFFGGPLSRMSLTCTRSLSRSSTVERDLVFNWKFKKKKSVLIGDNLARSWKLICWYMKHLFFRSKRDSLWLNTIYVIEWYTFFRFVATGWALNLALALAALPPATRNTAFTLFFPPLFFPISDDLKDWHIHVKTI